MNVFKSTTFFIILLLVFGISGTTKAQTLPTGPGDVGDVVQTPGDTGDTGETDETSETDETGAGVAIPGVTDTAITGPGTATESTGITPSTDATPTGVEGIGLPDSTTSTLGTMDTQSGSAGGCYVCPTFTYMEMEEDMDAGVTDPAEAHALRVNLHGCIVSYETSSNKLKEHLFYVWEQMIFEYDALPLPNYIEQIVGYVLDSSAPAVTQRSYRYIRYPLCSAIFRDFDGKLIRVFSDDEAICNLLLASTINAIPVAVSGMVEARLDSFELVEFNGPNLMSEMPLNFNFIRDEDGPYSVMRFRNTQDSIFMGTVSARVLPR